MPQQLSEKIVMSRPVSPRILVVPILIATLALGVTRSGSAQTVSTNDADVAVDNDSGGGQYADINGARIFYRVTGQGQPLILIHGYPLNSRLFAVQQQELSQTFQVITLDLRGFGKSTAPDADASIEVYASDVLGLMDLLGIQQATVGGHSMGGITALEIVKQAPERVRGLVLIDTTAAPAATFEQALWLGFAKQAQQDGVPSLAPPIVPEMLTGEARLHRPALVQFAEGLILQATTNGAVGGGIALANRPDHTALLPSISVPALIVVGIEDTVTPIPFAEQLRDGIPNSELLIIRHASHAANLERAERTNRAILEWSARQNLQ